ncbi:hypothetical protein FF098_008255 [Parvularcula flava]|uniref:TadE-like domain-containing protein n=1 Tax=Aquisalinus luteolus TaxID=1566827 RepID=A0A8J3A379_9PROT|nr:TadE/TadG family type IV pilus assembly protein [Aquisalinus luteolus]NHK27891.1 hypothetical protein [Aquisalinus luteolus]GGH96819.1 hypothetical protein GCM10011355_16620 [Aquisalinus luteolus]
MKGFFSDRKGIAATEFALIMPLLVMLSLSIFELTFRVQAADELDRYTFQLGDFLSRFAELTDDDIDEFYDMSDRIMPGVEYEESSLSVIIVSIGFEEDGDPVLLWTRSRGPDQLVYDIETARGLAPPGQSIMLIRTKLSTTTMFSVFGGTTLTLASDSVFKPRTTRAIAIDGDLTDVGEVIVGYENE